MVRNIDPNMHELFRTIIENSSDSPLVYMRAFQSAQAAGLPSADQIRFASIVVDLLFLSNTRTGTLLFRIGPNHQNQPVLQVELLQSDLLFETVLPALPSHEMISKFIPADTEQAFQSTHELVRHNNKATEQFTLAISHELKNTLTKLKLAISLLEVDDNPESILHHIGIIQRSSSQLENTLAGLNEIISITHGSYPASLVDLSTTFSKVYDEQEEKIKATDASIVTDFSGVSGFTYVEIYLQSIFGNLLSNALKYAIANRRPEIAIKAVNYRKGILITFSDNGQGIDIERYKHNLFKPFARFQSNSHHGKGLGLYIIKSIAERNGGSVTVESQPHNGTSFRLHLLPFN